MAPVEPNRSDGCLAAEAVAVAYRGADHDFIVLADHFKAEYGCRVTDTRGRRDERFTTILDGELSWVPRCPDRPGRAAGLERLDLAGVLPP